MSLDPVVMAYVETRQGTHVRAVRDGDGDVIVEIATTTAAMGEPVWTTVVREDSAVQLAEAFADLAKEHYTQSLTNGGKRWRK